MQDSDSEDEKEDSGFSLGGFIRNRLLLRAVFGSGEEEETAPVIQIDSGSTTIEEVEDKDTSLNDAPVEETPSEDQAEEETAH